MLHQYKAILAHVGQILSHVGICWANIGTMFDIGLILIHFGLVLGSCWAILGYVLAFISDLGISVSWTFGSMQGICKEYSIYKEKQHCLEVLMMFLMLCLITICARYFSVLRWHLNGTFGGMGGLLLVGVLAVVA